MHILPATGGSAMKAVEVIMEHGVPEDRIIFINLVCCLAEHSLTMKADLMATTRRSRRPRA